MKDKELQQIAEKALTDSVVRVVWQKADEESGEDLIWPFTRDSDMPGLFSFR